MRDVARIGQRAGHRRRAAVGEQATRGEGGSVGERASRQAAVLELLARTALRLGASRLVARRLELTVEGLRYLPPHGPVILAAHHYHHLYDGALLLATIPRPVHILVGVDWITSARQRRLMERACRTARWPMVLRAERFAAEANDPALPRSAFRPEEATEFLRRATESALRLLQEGRLLVVFPEGFPSIDPSFTPRRGDEPLPFRSGFARLAELSERATGVPVAIVPAGLSYARAGERWRVALRLGPATTRHAWSSRARLVAAIESTVRALSAPPAGTACIGPDLPGDSVPAPASRSRAPAATADSGMAAAMASDAAAPPIRGQSASAASGQPAVEAGGSGGEFEAREGRPA